MKKINLLLAGMVWLCLGLSQQLYAQNYRWVTGDANSSVFSDNQRSVMDKAGNTIITGKYNAAVDLDFGDGVADTAVLPVNPSGGNSYFFARYNEAGDFLWAKRLQNLRSGELPIKDVATDDAGNIYITGTYTGWCDFNLSDAAADTMIKYSTKASASSYTSSIYVAKYDTAGNFVWVINLSGGISEVADLAVKHDRLYLSGRVRTGAASYLPNKNTDFDPSELPADTLYMDGPSASAYNAFIAAYDLDGKLKAAKRLGNTTSSSTTLTIDADDKKNIYLSGLLNVKMDFNPSAAAADTAFLAAASGVFLARYDSLGNYQWVVPVLQNSNYTFTPNNIWLNIMPNSNVYVSGYYTGIADFNPAVAPADTLYLNAGQGISSYMARYDTGGHFVNAMSLGDTSVSKAAYINAVAADDSGYLYIAGEFTGKVDFNLSPGISDTAFRINTGANANPDIFFARYRNDTLSWSRKIGTSANQLLRGMGVNSKHLTIYGNFSGDVIFDPMPPVNIASQVLGDGTYLASYRTFPPSSEKELLTYSFSTPPATGTITGDTVYVTVPFGTSLTALVASFTVSPKATASVGATLQVSGSTANNHSGIVTYTIKAEDSTTKDYFVKVTVKPGVGLTEINTPAAAFHVWPNPVHDVLYFSAPADVKLYDISGRLLLASRKVNTLNVNYLAAGVYLLENESGIKHTIIIR